MPSTKLADKLRQQRVTDFLFQHPTEVVLAYRSRAPIDDNLPSKVIIGDVENFLILYVSNPNVAREENSLHFAPCVAIIGLQLAP